MGSEFNERAVASNKPIWSSEDWSSDGTEEGGGCMAQVGVFGCHNNNFLSELNCFPIFLFLQILNRNYVYGYYTRFVPLLCCRVLRIMM